MNETLQYKVRNSEDTVGSRSGVEIVGGQCLVTLDGINTIPVPRELGENIAVALRVQEKITDALMAGHRPGFLKTVSMLNCRKSISVVRDTRNLKELVSRKILSQSNLTTTEKIKNLEEVSGVPELMEDVERLMKLGKIPVLGSSDDMSIASYLDEHSNDFPVVVHVFDIVKRFNSEIIKKLFGKDCLTIKDCETKLHRDHTFLILGRDTNGTYICFQKRGPEISQPFELCSLDSVIKTSVVPETNRMYLSFIGPIGENP